MAQNLPLIRGIDLPLIVLPSRKMAELALIDGDPSQRIGDLRQVELVMRDGKIMQAQELRKSLGISGPPKAR